MLPRWRGRTLQHIGRLFFLRAVVVIIVNSIIDIDAGINVDLTAGNNSGGGDITIEAKSDSGTNSSGGNVTVNTNGNGDFTVDGSTVLP